MVSLEFLIVWSFYHRNLSFIFFSGVTVQTDFRTDQFRLISIHWTLRRFVPMPQLSSDVLENREQICLNLTAYAYATFYYGTDVFL